MAGTEGLPPYNLIFSFAMIWTGLGKMPQVAIRNTLPR